MAGETVLNSSLKKVAKGSGIILSGTFAGIILGLANRIVLVRYIDRAEYGLFSLSLVIVNIMTTVALVGFREGIPRYISYYRGKQDFGRIRGLIKASLQITTFLSTVILFLIILFAEPISGIFNMPDLEPVIRVLALLIPFNAVIDVLIAVFRGMEQSKPRVYFRDVLIYLLRLPMLGLSILLGLSLRGVLYAYLLSAVVLTAIMGLYAVRRIPTVIPGAEPSPVRKELFLFSVPLLGTSILGMLLTWTDTLMLGYFKSQEVVGLYNVAFPMATYISTILGAVAFIYFPVVSRLYSKNLLEDIQNVYRSVTKWIFVFSFPLFLILFLTPAYTLVFLFGFRYVDASNALRILSLGFFVHAFLGPNGLTLIALGRSGLTTLNTFVGIVVNIGLNLVLVPRFGLEGAAAASSVSLALSNILTSLQVYILSGIHPFGKDYARVVTVSVVSTVTVYKVIYMFPSIPYSITPLVLGLFLLATLLSLILTRSLDKEDIKLIEAVEHKFGIGNPVSRRALHWLAK